ncbi:hypothetical protein [Methylosinus sp. Sm6]|uniref:hypothetical protein n=1 Tax=Methylosinus sp. Sm6 TaxID=2866948 RepID=UPI001C99CB82|nr:hypothetical protein [Methylosinus sp. Sm6]MBY6242747.1 hypothetical protein [Methylosinus sp. Sm6]
MSYPVHLGAAAALGATIALTFAPSESAAAPTSVAPTSVVALPSQVATVGYYCARRHRHVRRVYHYVYGASPAPVVTTYRVYSSAPYYYDYGYGYPSYGYPSYGYGWSAPVVWGGGWGYRRSYGGWGGGWGGHRHFGHWGGGGWGGGGFHHVGGWGGGRGFGGGFHHGGFHHGGFGGFHGH